MRRRTAFLLATAGVLLAAVLVVVLAPVSFWERPTLSRLVAVFQTASDSSALVLLLLGIVFVLAFLFDALAGTNAESPTAIPIEERTEGVSSKTTGADLDDRLARFADRPDRDSVPEEVLTVAVDVLSRAENLSPEQARDQLTSGTWTDDARAAAFFSEDSPPAWIRLRDWLATQPTAQRQAEHAASRLAEVLDDERAPGDGDSDETVESVGGGAFEGVHHRVDRGETVSDGVTVTDGERADTDSGEEDSRGSVGPFETTRVRRQEVGITIAFLCGGLGIAFRHQTLLLLAVLGVVYASYEFVSSPPVPALHISRELGSPKPIPGDTVEVAVTVENRGRRPLTDLRYVDGVPGSLSVVEGSPGFNTALRSGESFTHTYTVRAKRGTFEFTKSDLFSYSLSGSAELRTTVDIPSRIECATLLDAVPLADQTIQQVGTVDSDTPGSGVEFHSVREYRSGDPLSRVDWNRLAKTGDLATVNFHEKRGTTVVLVVDTRDAVDLAPAASEIGGRDLCLYAAEETLQALLETGTQIGLVAYGEDVSRVTTDSGQTQRARIRSELRDSSDRYAPALGTDGLVDADSIDSGRVTGHSGPSARDIQQQLPSTAQVVLFSPVLDDDPVELVTQFQRSGHAVSVFSPAVTADASVGQRLEGLERSCRIQAIRETGAYVADWDPAEPLETAVTRLTRRHS